MSSISANNFFSIEFWLNINRIILADRQQMMSQPSPTIRLITSHWKFTVFLFIIRHLLIAKGPQRGSRQIGYKVFWFNQVKHEDSFDQSLENDDDDSLNTGAEEFKISIFFRALIWKLHKKVSKPSSGCCHFVQFLNYPNFWIIQEFNKTWTKLYVTIFFVHYLDNDLDFSD